MGHQGRLSKKTRTSQANSSVSLRHQERGPHRRQLEQRQLILIAHGVPLASASPYLFPSLSPSPSPCPSSSFYLLSDLLGPSPTEELEISSMKAFKKRRSKDSSKISATG